MPEKTFYYAAMVALRLAVMLPAAHAQSFTVLH